MFLIYGAKSFNFEENNFLCRFPDLVRELAVGCADCFRRFPNLTKNRFPSETYNK